MKKVVLNILFIVYVIIAIFVTICLLSYNDFKVTELGDYSLVIIDDKELSPEYEKGDLVIVNKDKEIKVGDKAFFYNTYNREIEIKLGEVISLEKITDKETTYTFKGNRKISSQYVLGTSKDVTVINKVGTILSILESKWGFLFIIVLPTLLAFVHQISVVFSELRNSKKEVQNKEK